MNKLARAGALVFGAFALWSLIEDLKAIVLLAVLMATLVGALAAMALIAALSRAFS